MGGCMARLAVPKILGLEIDQLPLLRRQSQVTFLARDRNMFADQREPGAGVVESRNSFPPINAVTRGARFVHEFCPMRGSVT